MWFLGPPIPVIPTPWVIPEPAVSHSSFITPLLKIENFEMVVSIAQSVPVLVSKHNNIILALVIASVIIAAVRWLRSQATRTDNEV